MRSASDNGAPYPLTSSEFILPAGDSRASLPTNRACSHHVLQRFNGEAAAVGELQVLQIRGKQWSFGLQVDPGKDFEFRVSETTAVYEMQLGTEKAMFVEWITWE